MVGISNGVIGSMAGQNMFAELASEAYLVYGPALDW